MCRSALLYLTSAAVLFAAAAAKAQTPTQATAASYGMVGVADVQCDCACDSNACDSGNCCNSCCDPWCSCNGYSWLANDLSGCWLPELGFKSCPCWEIGGWTQLGYTDNNIPLSQTYNDLLSFNDVPDHLHLNQQWIYAGKKADGSYGFDIGGRVDVVYGTDAQKTQAFGNPNAGVRGFGTWDASLDHGEYGWAVPQLYAELAYYDWSLKAGHFFSLFGYEAVASSRNFFYSHSYAFSNNQALTLTGLLASYTGYENWTLYGGWTLGWDTGFDQLNQGNNFLGGFTYALSSWAQFSYYATYGNFGWRDGGDENSIQQLAMLNMSLTDQLTWVIQADQLDTSNPGVSEFDTIGLTNYLIYRFSDMIAVGGRYEWWKADGVSFFEATGGVNIYLSENFVIRPEVRQDWAPGIGLDEDTAAIDMILMY